MCSTITQTPSEKILQRRLQMLIHSCIYYVFSENFITDHQFDIWNRELAALQQKYPEESKVVPWYREFSDWTGRCGGSHLPLRNPWVINKSLRYIAFMLDKSVSEVANENGYIVLK